MALTSVARREEAQRIAARGRTAVCIPDDDGAAMRTDSEVNAKETMLIDEVLSPFDATIIEHIVIDAPPVVVYETAREMDFMQIHSPLVDAVMNVRTLPTRVGSLLGAKPAPSAAPTMRLAELLDRSAEPEGLEGWLGLGEVPGREIVFGAIGKVWQPDIDWKSVSAEEFRDFAEPDYAKVAVGFSIRAYGTERSLLSYEARTAGTDDAARQKFLRYWWLVRRFVHFVMRAAVVTVKDLAEEAEASRHQPPQT